MHRVGMIAVRLTTPAKTVADCFKYRRIVGQDLAIEVLRTYVEQRAGSLDALREASCVCRVETVMRPYLEAFL